MGIRFTTICARWFFLVALLHGAWGDAQVFRVASYNIENFLAAPSGSRPAKSVAARAQVCRNIAALHPDVIALEEVGSTNALLGLQAALKKAGIDLPNWELVNGYDTNIHVSILSRFPIVARRPHTNDNFLLDGHRMQVSRGFAEVDIRVNPHYTFTLIAAHLKSRRTSSFADEAEWRCDEALALRRAIDARLSNAPRQDLIVLGDFNDSRDSKPLRAVMGRGRGRLFDTRPAERNGDQPENAGKGHETRNITWTHYYAKDDTYARLDYILVNHTMEAHWLPEETFVLSAPNWGLASDHRALVAGFLPPTTVNPAKN